MNKEYKIKLDLNKKLYNKKMAFNQFDENVNDFYIEVTKNNEVVKDLDKSIITLVAIKPNNTVDAQFIEVKEGQIYADLKPSMCDLVGNYQAKAMIVLEGEIVTTDTINYSVNEDKIISRLNGDIVSDERFTLFTDALARLSTIEISEEQRMINEAERILAEENRKIEEAKRVEAELIRQHEEADRTKYDATRESNENIRKQNESIRLSNETNRIDEEAKRVEEENKRKLAEEERKANYNFMIEDEERRRSEANAHKEAEVLRVQAETNRVNEEAKRRTTEQARVSAENTRVGNENTRKANEEARQSNETKRVEAETQRQSRYNSFIVDAEANANNFENYTNTAKVKEEERKSNELDRKSQEDRRISNEVERISNENTRKANEVIREENETSRQNTFANKVSEVDEKISELNTTKDNFVSSVNTKVDNKISEIEVAKSDMINDVSSTKANMVTEVTNAKNEMTTTVTNKVNEVEGRFNALTASQQQSSEVIDARDGEVSLKARLDRDIEKAKQVYVGVEGSHISTDSSSGYAKDVEILGNTIQDASNLADIRSVGDKVEGQELYEIPVLSCGKNLFDSSKGLSDGIYTYYVPCKPNTSYITTDGSTIWFYDENKTSLGYTVNSLPSPSNAKYLRKRLGDFVEEAISKVDTLQIEEGTVATPYEPYQEDKLTILSPVQLEKGDVLKEVNGVWGVEKNRVDKIIDSSTKLLEYVNQGNTSRVAIDCENVLFRSLAISNELIGRVFDGLDTEGVSIGGSPHIFLNILNSKLSSPSLNGVKEYVTSNNILIKHLVTNPQFIPLPHDQQIKLRTFANKTNISFGCEIEGTIKAQVPKSLGATVNTHTEQISNLNKELDRVKKLEESTVSTVTTESDFTTVEATSNGYFEDVKLEGKTLVNTVTTYNVSRFSLKNATKQDDGYFKLQYGATVNDSNVIPRYGVHLYKPNTTYTVIVDIKENTTGTFLGISAIHSCINSATISKRDFTNLTGISTITFKTRDDITVSDKGVLPTYDLYFGIWKDGGDLSNHITFRYWVLEGDHTQNPPSYFEGLKSVSDGVDEIVVESVKGDGNLFRIEDFKISAGNGVINQNSGTYTTMINKDNHARIKIKVKPNTEYIVNCDAQDRPFQWRFRDINQVMISPLVSPYDTNTIHTINTGNNEYIYVELFQRVTDSSYSITFSNIYIGKSSGYSQYTPHQSDKKRLLYYNNETQAWEKPILRQWDSIEKHADGKYYYHQRSAEVVLNGSESTIRVDNNTKAETITFAIGGTGVLPTSSNITGNIICDKFITRTGSDNYNNELEGVSINGKGEICINILKSKLSTQDVAGFKQWLQANNVTVVYQLAQEKVYECTNIDLITYANETNYIVECGAIVPRSTLKVHNNISNVVSLLQKKVSLLESNITSYMITQNRLMLASRYNADTVSFKVDVATLRNSFEYDNDLYELILNNILVGKDNYNREYIENLIIFYWMDFVISDEMYLTLFEIIEEQHNPKVIETPLI